MFRFLFACVAVVEPNSAIVVVLDRLGAGFLGPYGNTWADTPHWNRLAAQSLLLEFALADSPDLELLCRSFWSGRHAMDGGSADSDAVLLDRLDEAGVTCALISDDPRVGEHPLAAAFHERVALPPPEAAAPAEDVAETHAAKVLAAAMDWLEDVAEPFLLWVHAQAMEGPWDAPLALRRRFMEQGDPEPWSNVSPPEARLPRDADPDRLLAVVHAYAGHVAALDRCLGALLDAIDALASASQRLSARTALAVTSPRGYPLGEHGRIGRCDDALYGELLHVPWLLRLPDRRGAARRSRRLVQPPDWCATLLEWCLGEAPEASPWGRSVLPLLDGRPVPPGDRAAAAGPGQRAIRTPAWFLREDRSTEPVRRELFAKPDDRWEVNEVANRCLDVVEQLGAALEEFEHAVRSGSRDALSPLPELLVAGPA